MPLLYVQGRFPTRRTWERWLLALPQQLPGLIGYFGRPLVALLTPWSAHGCAVAVDSTPVKTSGGIWHKQPKEAGEIPHTSIDTAAGWSKSGWQGWWYGWKLHLAVSVGAVWLPLAAARTAANTADNTVAPQLLAPLPAEVRYQLNRPMQCHCCSATEQADQDGHQEEGFRPQNRMVAQES